MNRRRFMTGVASPFAALALGCRAHTLPARERANAPAVSAPAVDADDRRRIVDAMKRAARFMRERVAYRGGYLWSYLPDFSRSWGELEAHRGMIWLQPPGTSSVGHVMMDAYNATGDAYYLDAAGEVATALVDAQHASGGWNYFYDFRGQASAVEWYATIGRNAWRLEEFHQYTDDATFDDACTAQATQLLLRVEQAKPTPAVSQALERALAFIEQSQHASGGWPQRYPLRTDYTRFVTFNDDVHGENIRTLLMAFGARGGARFAKNIWAAMRVVPAMQGPSPAAGWALQHDLHGAPAAARSFEPGALATHTTAANVDLCITFHELTGDGSFTGRVPEALEWLRRVALSPELARERGGTHPTFIDIVTGAPLYVHRRGSNVWNGEYYVDPMFEPRLAHYSPVRTVDLAALQQRYDGSRVFGSAAVWPPVAGSVPLPEFFSLRDPSLLSLCTGRYPALPRETRQSALALVDALDEQGRWLEPLEALSNPHRGAGEQRPFNEATYAGTYVGDSSDTSPYPPASRPSTYPDEPAPLGISVRAFIRNMARLTAHVAP